MLIWWKCIWHFISSNLELIFYLQDCHFLIVQVKYQDQTIYTRILDLKPLPIHIITLKIDWTHRIWNISRPDKIYPYSLLHKYINAYYHIGNRFDLLQLKYFYLPQFLLNADWGAHWPQKSKTPFIRAGSLFRYAALHRIWFRRCWFLPLPYFYSETNKWLKVWAKWWVVLWLATTSRQFYWKSNFTWKIKETCHGPKITKHNFFLPLKWVSITGVVPQASLLLPAATWTAADWGTLCVCACLSDLLKLCWSTALWVWPAGHCGWGGGLGEEDLHSC